MKRSPLVILLLTVLLDLIGFGIVLPLLPTYAKDLGANPFMIGLIAAIFSIMQFIFSPLWGKLSDKIGRRSILSGFFTGKHYSSAYFCTGTIRYRFSKHSCSPGLYYRCNRQ